MKKYKRIISALMCALLLGASLLMTACSGDAEDLAESEDEGILMTLDLPSDSDNGDEWTFEQDDKLFSCEDMFLEDEGEEAGEEQSFTLRPIKAGSTSIRFINKTTDTTYTYECTVNDSKDDITVDGSKGESGGKEVNAPEIFVENN